MTRRAPISQRRGDGYNPIMRSLKDELPAGFEGETVMHIWQIQEAGNKFSELIEQALQQGPQIISRQGKETAIVLSYEDYRKLALSQKKLSDFFRESPLVGLELDLERDQSLPRQEVLL